MKERLVHRFKFAYCVARPAHQMAVFAVPPTMNKLAGIPHESSVTSNDISVLGCEVGKWYSLAYGKCQYGWGMKVLGEVTA